MSGKAEIARINGAKSNGPVTSEGKATSSQNSLKHGLTSSRVVLPHESQEEYDALESSFLRRLNPADEVETELVMEMVASRWRLRRIELMESALFKKAMREQKELLGSNASALDIRDAAYVEVAESKTMRTLSTHARHLRTAYERAGKELENLQNQRKQQEHENEPTVRSNTRPTMRLTSAILDRLTAPPLSMNDPAVLAMPFHRQGATASAGR